jgi:glycine betaine/proline transport system substrate-binding protein
MDNTCRRSRSLFGLVVICVFCVPFVVGQDGSSQFWCFSQQERVTINPNRITVKLQEDAWLGSELNLQVASILLREKVGFNVEIVPPAEIETNWPGLSVGDVHANLEIWPSGTLDPNRAQYNNTVMTSNNGLIGQIGWYTPTWVTSVYPNISDYRSFLRDDVTNFYKVNANDRRAPFYTGPSTWVQYETYLFQNYEMDFRVYFLDDGETALEEQVANHMNGTTPVLVYFWIPHPVLVKYNLTRINLPAWNSSCYEVNFPYGVWCDYPASNLYKGVWMGLEQQAYGAYQLLNAFQYTSDADQMEMLALVTNEGVSTQQAACTWIQRHNDTWANWIPTVVDWPTSNTQSSSSLNLALLLGLLIPLTLLALVVLIGIVVGSILVWYVRSKQRQLVEPNYKVLAFASIARPIGTEDQSAEQQNVYNMFYQLLMRERAVDFAVTDTLGMEAGDEVATTLLYLAAAEGSALSLMRDYLQREIVQARKAGNTDGLFSGDSTATLMFRSYARIVGLPYLWHTYARYLFALSHKHITDDDDIELGEMPKEITLKKRDADSQKKFLVVLDNLWNLTRNSVAQVPFEIKMIAKYIKKTCIKEGVTDFPKAIGAFVYTRFVCPAISAPHIYGLCPDELSGGTQRLLGEAARVLHQLCEMQKFQDEEEPMNQWIEAHLTEAQDLFTNLADVDKSAEQDNALDLPRATKENSLAALYAHALAKSSAITSAVQSVPDSKFVDKEQTLSDLEKIFNQSGMAKEAELEAELQDEMNSDMSSADDLSIY